MSWHEKVSVVVNESDDSIYLATPDGGSNLERSDAVGLIGALAEALIKLAPEEDPRWREDSRREGVSQTTALEARARRERQRRG